MDFIGKQFETPKGGILTVVGISSRKMNRVKVYILECSLCSNDKELFPDDIESMKGHLLDGKIPCGCSKTPKWSKLQHVVLIERMCKNRNISFCGLNQKYNGQKTKINLHCNKCLHVWSTGSIRSLLSEGKGCPKCGGSYPLSLEDVHKNIQTSCEDKNIMFDGFCDENGYKNNRSFIRMKCGNDETHQWSVSYMNLVYKKSGCPFCAVSGYRQSLPGYFYVYRYEIEGKPPIYKYGITNRTPDIRSSEHINGIKNCRKKKIFSFFFEDGGIPAKIEKYIDSNFDVGVCGWLISGNTETVSANTKKFETDIIDIIRNVKYENN